MARIHECYAVWLKENITAEVFYTKKEADAFFKQNQKKVHRYCHERLVARYESGKATFEVKSETQIYPALDWNSRPGEIQREIRRTRLFLRSLEPTSPGASASRVKQ
jgi:hypothetical protein